MGELCVSILTNSDKRFGMGVPSGTSTSEPAAPACQRLFLLETQTTDEVQLKWIQV